MMFEDISVVVQGPVQALPDREQDKGITVRCLESVRKHLPGATIILSTWHNQNLDELDFDELVLCDDPGPNIREYNSKGEPHYFNNNRQIVSTREGLKKVKTKYAVKLRSDNYLTNNKFIEYQKKYRLYSNEYKFLKERVVISNIFTRKYAKGLPVAFHISDFFYYGLTCDLLTLWDIPLSEDFISNKQGLISPSAPYHLIDCTQMFVIKSLNYSNIKIDMSHMHDYKNNVLLISKYLMTNNFIILDEQKLQLGLPEKFRVGARISKTKGRCSFYYFFEWEDMYKKYCDTNYLVKVDILKRVTLFLHRLFYIFPRSLETIFNIIKRKYT